MPTAMRSSQVPVSDLGSREDIERLLVRFYEQAMVDPLLGPVLVDVAHLDLSVHLPRIADFWERSLLGTGTYVGQPMAVHRHLHALVPLTPAMFERWLSLWAVALDELASGPVATLAKDTAVRVASATLQHLEAPPTSSDVSITSKGRR